MSCAITGNNLEFLKNWVALGRPLPETVDVGVPLFSVTVVSDDLLDRIGRNNPSWVVERGEIARFLVSAGVVPEVFDKASGETELFQEGGTERSLALVYDAINQQ